MPGRTPLSTAHRPSLLDRSRLTEAKIGIAQLLCARWVALLISRTFRHRVPHRGHRIDLRDVDIDPATEALIFWGIYERAECRFIRRYLPSDVDVIELGSSLGVTSAAIARRLEPGRRMICVEPNEDLLTTIRRNVNRHRAAPSFDIVHAAVSSQVPDSGITVPFLPGVHTYGSRLADEPTDFTRSVPTTTVPHLRAQFDLGSFALVSDIEGSEAAFLLGADDELAGCDHLIIELHDTHWAGRAVPWSELRDAILARGFVIAAQRGPVVVCRRSPPG